MDTVNTNMIKTQDPRKGWSHFHDDNCHNDDDYHHHNPYGDHGVDSVGVLLVRGRVVLIGEEWNTDRTSSSSYSDLYYVFGFLGSVAKGTMTEVTEKIDLYSSDSTIASAYTSASTKAWNSKDTNPNSSIPSSNIIGIGDDTNQKNKEN